MIADPPRWLYVALILAVLIAGCVWAKYQSRPSWLALLACLLPLTGLVVGDWLLESPREEASRRVQAMAAAAEAGQVEEFLQHVSPGFSKNGRTRDDLRQSAVWQLIRDNQAAVRVWNFSRDDCAWLNDDEIQIGFMAKGEAAQGFIMRYCRATFRREPTQEWKMTGIHFYNPVQHGTRVEDPIAGFP